MQMPDDAYERLSGKLDGFSEVLSGVRVDVAEIRSELKDVADHEQRLRVVEKFQWKLLGVCTTVAIIVPIIVTVLAKLIIGA